MDELVRVAREEPARFEAWVRHIDGEFRSLQRKQRLASVELDALLWSFGGAFAVLALVGTLSLLVELPRLLRLIGNLAGLAFAGGVVLVGTSLFVGYFLERRRM